ncbi:MAG: glycosyltransferase family 2 protein [Planctomycetes bacterium]|nr:glycosyltransferase family 2 protein [Planctomycetota bacterium]
MTPPEPPALSVCAPAYNECDGIEAVIRDWLAVLGRIGLSFEIVVANDGSTDGTGEILQKLEREIPQLRIVHLTKNGGYGRALTAAIAASRGKFVATIDSDGQFDVADAKKLLDRAERDQCDLVTGYRVAKKDSFLRVLANAGQNTLVNILCGARFRDSNCALKVVRGDLIRSMKLEATGYPFPTEICVRISARGHKIAEEPVSHRERPAGRSKLKFLRTVIRMLIFLFYLRKRIKLYRAGHLQDI